jgi:hypothetical protein
MRALVVLLLLAVPGLALAHGDAEWIMRDSRTAYCCGVSDCAKEPAGAVLPVREGYRILDTGQLFRFGDPHLHPSQDGDYWTCRPQSMEGAVKCLFVPLMG